MKEDNVTTLLFDDGDEVVLAYDAAKAAYMTRKRVEEYRKWGLKIKTD